MAKQKRTSSVPTLPALLSAHGRLHRAEQIVSERRQERDDLIRLLLAQGHSVRSLATSLGMARQSVMAIRDEGVVKPTPLQGDPLF